jgi:hypothetical protein
MLNSPTAVSKVMTTVAIAGGISHDGSPQIAQVFIYQETPLNQGVITPWLSISRKRLPDYG